MELRHAIARTCRRVHQVRQALLSSPLALCSPFCGGMFKMFAGFRQILSNFIITFDLLSAGNAVFANLSKGPDQKWQTTGVPMGRRGWYRQRKNYYTSNIYKN
eukprot:834368-Rhodomonas_salina.1